jgi:hypothetical protein
VKSALAIEEGKNGGGLVHGASRKGVHERIARIKIGRLQSEGGTPTLCPQQTRWERLWRDVHGRECPDLSGLIGAG